MICSTLTYGLDWKKKKEIKKKCNKPTTEPNATHNTVACYYDQQNHSCGRDRTPQYQPFHMNTPTVLLAASHTLRGNREESLQSRRKNKKKKKMCASCQTWNRACAFVCDREKRREDISGGLRVWRRDRRTERVNNSWISVMCYRECCESGWRRRRRRRRKRQGHGKTERWGVSTPALFLARAALSMWPSGDCSFGGFSCSPYLFLICTGSVSVRHPLYLSACSFARQTARTDKRTNWDESVINWRDSMALYRCVLHTWLLRPHVSVWLCVCVCVCLSVSSQRLKLISTYK